MAELRHFLVQKALCSAVGTPICRIVPVSGETQVSVEFPQDPLVRRIPENSFWGPHFDDLEGFFEGNERGHS